MSADQSRTKTIVAAAIGVGILAGAAGLLGAYLSAEHSKRRRAFQHHLNRNSIACNDNISREKDLESEKEERMSRSTNSTCPEFFDCYSDWEDLENAPEEAREKQDKGEKTLLEQVDKLLKGDDGKRLKAFELLKENEENMSGNPEFLWRYAKAHQIQGIVCGYKKNETAKKEHILEGLKFASKALKLDSSNPDAHKWFAILTGMSGDYVTVMEKIQRAKEFYIHVNKAIQIKPNDYSLHHLLGRFKFEVASTPWMQKKLAAAVFGSFPDFTFSDAIKNLLMAESLSPTPWIENRLLLGKCCISQNLMEDAASWLHKALLVDPKTLEDSYLLDEAKLLLEKC